jgi:hypothetical protein
LRSTIAPASTRQARARTTRAPPEPAWHTSDEFVVFLADVIAWQSLKQTSHDSNSLAHATQKVAPFCSSTGVGLHLTFYPG